MSAGLPRDPVMLLSVVNTKLRDYYSTLDVLCEDMQVDKQELIGKLEMIDSIIHMMQAVISLCEWNKRKLWKIKHL